MSAELPQGVDPTKMPPLDVLARLTDDDLYQCVRWWAEENSAIVGPEFWIDELSRRRTARILDRIADATAENADQVARATALTEKGAAQNLRMVALTDSIRRLTWLIAGLTLVNTVAVIAALVA